MSQLLEYTKKIDKKSRKKIEQLFLVQNFLKRKMSQLLDNTKKLIKNREKKSKNYCWSVGSELSEANNEGPSQAWRSHYYFAGFPSSGGLDEF